MSLCGEMERGHALTNKGKHPEQSVIFDELPWVGFEPMTHCVLGRQAGQLSWLS